LSQRSARDSFNDWARANFGYQHSREPNCTCACVLRKAPNEGAMRGRCIVSLWARRARGTPKADVGDNAERTATAATACNARKGNMLPRLRSKSQERNARLSRSPYNYSSNTHPTSTSSSSPSASHHDRAFSLKVVLVSPESPTTVSSRYQRLAYSRSSAPIGITFAPSSPIDQFATYRTLSMYYLQPS
jgi:hypothetical protein